MCEFSGYATNVFAKTPKKRKNRGKNIPKQQLWKDASFHFISFHFVLFHSPQKKKNVKTISQVNEYAYTAAYQAIGVTILRSSPFEQHYLCRYGCSISFHRICSSCAMCDPMEMRSAKLKKMHANTQAYAPIVIPSHSTIKRSNYFHAIQTSSHKCVYWCYMRIFVAHLATLQMLEPVMRMQRQCEAMGKQIPARLLSIDIVLVSIAFAVLFDGTLSLLKFRNSMDKMPVKQINDNRSSQEIPVKNTIHL